MTCSCFAKGATEMVLVLQFFQTCSRKRRGSFCSHVLLNNFAIAPCVIVLLFRFQNLDLGFGMRDVALLAFAAFAFLLCSLCLPDFLFAFLLFRVTQTKKIKTKRADLTVYSWDPEKMIVTTQNGFTVWNEIRTQQFRAQPLFMPFYIVFLNHLPAAATFAAQFAAHLCNIPAESASRP